MHADAATLGFYQALGQRQSQTGALIMLANPNIELLEGDEQTVDFLRRDADTRVLDLEPIPLGSVGQGAEHDAAVFRGELHCVGHVVVEHLLDPPGVGDDLLHLGIDAYGHLDLLVGG